MNLQNGYKGLYERTADGTRTFYATQTGVCNPEVDTKIADAVIGQYKLIYEKAGQIYGSTSGIPADGDKCFTEFDSIFKEATGEPVVEPANIDDKVEEDEPEVTVEDENTEGDDNGGTSIVETE